MAPNEDADNADGEEREQYPWVIQQPNARVVGTPVDLIYTGDLSSSVAQNNDSYIVVFEDARVVNGGIYRNKHKPADGTTDEVAGEDSSRPTDYRLVSQDSGVGTWVEDLFTTGEQSETEDGDGMNVYEAVDDFDEDRIAVFYNGMAGNRVGRTLDFNGLQYARWTETPYLVKGLYQAHPDWRGAGSEQRSSLAGEGKAPRVARVPIPRMHVDGSDYVGETVDDFGEIVVDMTKLRPDDPESGYEIHIFDAEAMKDEFGDLTTAVDDMDRGRYGLDVDSELDYTTHDDPEAILEQAEVGYMMHTGDGWPDEPSDWELEYDLQPSFGIEAAVHGDEEGGNDGPTDEAAFEEDLHNFASEVAEALPDGQSPEEVFDGGLDGLVNSRADQFRGREPTDEDVEKIRTEVYGTVNWLDAEELQE